MENTNNPAATATNEVKELIGQVTPEQIETWKKAHEVVQAFKTETGITYFKNPDRTTLKSASDGTIDGLSEYNDIVAENCFLGGDKNILSDADYYQSFNRFINRIAKGKEGEVVNF